MTIQIVAAIINERPKFEGQRSEVKTSIKGEIFNDYFCSQRKGGNGEDYCGLEFSLLPAKCSVNGL
jgi:hypothetical protein